QSRLQTRAVLWSSSGPATSRPPDHRDDSCAPYCSEEEGLRVATTVSDRTCLRYTPPTCFCRFRSLATGRGEIPDRLRQVSEPPASTAASGHWADRQSSKCARRCASGS